MVRCNLMALLILMIAWQPRHGGSVSGNSYLPPEMEPMLQQIIDHTVLQQYEKAFALSEQLQKEYPQNPAGYFLHAAALQAAMMDYEDYHLMGRFNELTRRVEEICEKDIKASSNNAWPYFFLGAACGYEAVYCGRQKDYGRAFKYGWRSIRYLQRALALDPKNYDIYLGIGTYKYYKSKYSKFLNFLPFVEDEREEGIQMIRMSIEKGKFSRAAAMNTLIWIYIGEERFEEAEKLVEMATQEYPGSRFFFWGKAAVAYKRERWSEAARAFQQIIDSYAAENRSSAYNELVCHTVLAEIALKQKDYKKANSHAETALAIKLDKMFNKRAEKFIKQAKRIRDESREHQGVGEE